MRILHATFVLLVMACGGPTATMTVETSGAEVASLGRYRTYMHAKTDENAPEGYARGALRPVVLEKARRDVDAQLQGRGYELAEYGELVIHISSGSRTVEDQPTGHAAIAGAPSKLETEGELVIDIVERASGKQVFHGFARDVIHGGHLEDEKLTQAVAKILQPIPASVR